MHIALDSTDFLVVFPLKGEGRARLIGTVRQEAEQQHEQLSWNDVSRRVLEWISIDIKRVNWFSTYRVHHRVAAHFRQGLAFLLGDAAHIHSPVGGQGMNTGIGDAVNLAWKLAAVLRGRADASIIDSYEPERIAFARRLVATTDRAFTSVTSSGAFARLIRLHIVPLLLAPDLLRESSTTPHVSHRFPDCGQLSWKQPERRACRKIHGGDRLPWVKSDSTVDNFAPLNFDGWQVHIYGDAAPEIRTACEQHHLPLHVFPWVPAASRTGLRRNAVYLIRP